MQGSHPNPSDFRRLRRAETSTDWYSQPLNAAEVDNDPQGPLPSPQETIGLILLALGLYAAFSIIENANWVRGLPPLIIPILAALALGSFVAGKSRLIGYPLVLVVGAVVTLGLGLPLLDGGAHTIFGLFFLSTAWFVTHLTLRLASSGRPILIPLPGLLLIIVALAFLDEDYFFHLPLYVIASAPAVAFFHLQKQSGLGRRMLLPAALAAGLVLSLGAVAFSWPTPTPNAPVRPAAASTLEEPIFELWESGAGLFKNIPSRKGWLKFDLQPALPFVSPVEQGESVIMRVSSPEAHRWRLRVYDIYTPQGWVSIPNAPRTPEDLPSIIPAPEPGASRDDVRIEVRLFSSNTHVATAGLPIRSTVSGLIESSPQPAFNLFLADPQTFYLPSDISQLKRSVLEAPNSTISGLEAALEAQGLTFTVPPPEDASLLEANLIVHRLEAGSYPTTALMFARRQNPPRSYATLGSVSTATPVQLRNASRTDDEQGIVYPHWIGDRYLQLPPDFPQPVRDVAQDLAEGHDNTYDVAMSIQSYLHKLKYGEQVIPPPPNVDAVEWFLTTQRVGFCNYFASAMITMLRSLDIPARLVVGFAPGQWDEGRNTWIVRTKDYHAWPEVYFPEYGWVEFEPTPPGVQPSLENLGFQTAAGSTNADFLDECFGDVFACEEDLDPAGGEDDLPLGDLLFRPVDTLPVTAQGGGPLDLLLRPYILWPLVSLAVIALVVLASNLYLGFLTRRLGLPVLAFAGISFMARLSGLPRNDNETPAEYGARLTARLPRYAALVDAVVVAYERAVYGRNKHLEDDAYDNLRWSWDALRWPFIRLALRRLVPLKRG